MRSNFVDAGIRIMKMRYEDLISFSDHLLEGFITQILFCTG